MSEDINKLFEQAKKQRDVIQHHQRKLQTLQQKIQTQLQDLKQEFHEKHDDSLITVNQAAVIMGKSRQTVSRYIRKGWIKKRAGKLLKSEVKQLKQQVKQKKGFSLIHEQILLPSCEDYADRNQRYNEKLIGIKDIEFHL